MASAVEIVEELMPEFGKSTPKVRQEVEGYVRAITVDLLSQGKGRFSELEEDILFTLDPDFETYKFPAGYNTIQKTGYQVTVDGVPTGTKISIETKQTAMERRYANEYAGARIYWIDFQKGGRSGRGWYLVLSAAPDAVDYYQLFYYRQATAEDTDLIRNAEIVRTGVRARYHLNRADPFSQSKGQGYLTTYNNMKSGFREDPMRHKPRIGITLNPRAREVTSLQWDIGEGN